MGLPSSGSPRSSGAPAPGLLVGTLGDQLGERSPQTRAGTARPPSGHLSGPFSRPSPSRQARPSLHRDAGGAADVGDRHAAERGQLVFVGSAERRSASSTSRTNVSTLSATRETLCWDDSRLARTSKSAGGGTATSGRWRSSAASASSLIAASASANDAGAGDDPVARAASLIRSRLVPLRGARLVIRSGCGSRTHRAARGAGGAAARARLGAGRLLRRCGLGVPAGGRLRVLGPAHVAAATAVSPSLPQARAGGGAELRVRPRGTARLRRRRTRWIGRATAANAGDRCYFCKAELLDVVGPVAAAARPAVMSPPAPTPTTRSPVSVPAYAPAHERGAVTPLRDAGLTKAQVREASRRWGLATADKPAAACLSSRIAYGIAITPAPAGPRRSGRGGAAGRFGRRGPCRTRPAGARPRRRRPGRGGCRPGAGCSARPDLLAAVTGFARVELDPRGFRSGSMNELLTRS